MKMLRIGARQSDLARLQAYAVGEALEEKHPGLKIEYFFKASLGDVNLTDPLWKMPEKGVFTEDFLGDLRENRVDLVVHSFKDLPVEERIDTEIIGTLERADMRDLLLIKKDSLARGLTDVKIFSSSPRRSYNLSRLLPRLLPGEIKSVEFIPVRGNIATRLKKYLEGSVDGFIVAKAAIDRLIEDKRGEFKESHDRIGEALSKSRFMVLPLSENPNAAAQGALAIKVRKGDEQTKALVSRVTSAIDFELAGAERAWLKSFGGGCHQKIGVSLLDRPYGRIMFLRGETDQGETLEKSEIHGGKKVPKPASLKACWPINDTERATAHREEISCELPNSEAFFIARADAVRTDWSLDSESLIWAAGLRTWEKLARRGLWVSGSSEGLGENEDKRIKTLFGREPRWVKLTHESAGRYGLSSKGHDSFTRQVATYRVTLELREEWFKNKTHLYWSSPEHFRQAVALVPEIEKSLHFCGPGHTFDFLTAATGDPERVFVCLSESDFREQMLKLLA